MKTNITNHILKHHDVLFKKYKASAKSLGILKGQSVRFDVISQVGNLENSSILDIGCGFGDFYGFLKFKKIKTRYYGVDINKDFINIAKERYSSGKFEVRDIETKPFSQKFDWVIGIGITTLSSIKNTESLIKEMFRICRKGVAIDFLSSYVDYKEKELFYTSPEKIFSFAKTLTRRASLRHDYKPFEFCLYLYKDDSKNKKNYFKEHLKNLPKDIQNDSWIKSNR